MRAFEGESLAELCRAVTQVGPPAAALSHDVASPDRDAGPQEHGSGCAARCRDDVRAVVHPVREIDVEMARLPEHHSVPRGHAAVAMRARIVPTAVGLYFGQAHCHAGRNEQLADQVRRDLERRPVEKGAWEASQWAFT